MTIDLYSFVNDSIINKKNILEDTIYYDIYLDNKLWYSNFASSQFFRCKHYLKLRSGIGKHIIVFKTKEGHFFEKEFNIFRNIYFDLTFYKTLKYTENDTILEIETYFLENKTPFWNP